ncbi:hypothetical protein CDAR_200622 [Caerostris darwini]|uniref:Immunoglobulin I-set domain-containing protein n=1 Tax=Caerostris darwini TaxID=1538125 RepID=A0AAV4TZX6_9ARAC|nr:hypothetical protein CDAR_200622 [Caerostris darwini]
MTTVELVEFPRKLVFPEYGEKVVKIPYSGIGPYYNAELYRNGVIVDNGRLTCAAFNEFIMIYAKAVKKSDKGIYKLILRNVFEQAEATFTLKVRSGPKIQDCPAEVFCLEGAPARFKVGGKSMGSCSLQLFKNKQCITDNRITFENFDNVIIVCVKKVCKADRGKYEIVVKNNLGQSKAEFSFKVIGISKIEFPKELFFPYNRQVCKISHSSYGRFFFIRMVKEGQIENDRIRCNIFEGCVTISLIEACKNDEGLYKIVLKNNFELAEATFTLKVGGNAPLNPVRPINIESSIAGCLSSIVEKTTEQGISTLSFMQSGNIESSVVDCLSSMVEKTVDQGISTPSFVQPSNIESYIMDCISSMVEKTANQAGFFFFLRISTPSFVPASNIESSIMDCISSMVEKTADHGISTPSFVQPNNIESSIRDCVSSMVEKTADHAIDVVVSELSVCKQGISTPSFVPASNIESSIMDCISSMVEKTADHGILTPSNIESSIMNCISSMVEKTANHGISTPSFVQPNNIESSIRDCVSSVAEKNADRGISTPSFVPASNIESSIMDCISSMVEKTADHESRTLNSGQSSKCQSSMNHGISTLSFVQPSNVESSVVDCLSSMVEKTVYQENTTLNSVQSSKFQSSMNHGISTLSFVQPNNVESSIMDCISSMIEKTADQGISTPSFVQPSNIESSIVDCISSMVEKTADQRIVTRSPVPSTIESSVADCLSSIIENTVDQGIVTRSPVTSTIESSVADCLSSIIENTVDQGIVTQSPVPSSTIESSIADCLSSIIENTVDEGIVTRSPVTSTIESSVEDCLSSIIENTVDQGIVTRSPVTSTIESSVADCLSSIIENTVDQGIVTQSSVPSSTIESSVADCLSSIIENTVDKESTKLNPVLPNKANFSMDQRMTTLSPVQPNTEYSSVLNCLSSMVEKIINEASTTTSPDEPRFVESFMEEFEDQGIMMQNPVPSNNAEPYTEDCISFMVERTIELETTPFDERTKDEEIMHLRLVQPCNIEYMKKIADQECSLYKSRLRNDIVSSVEEIIELDEYKFYFPKELAFAENSSKTLKIFHSDFRPYFYAVLLKDKQVVNDKRLRCTVVDDCLVIKCCAIRKEDEGLYKILLMNNDKYMAETFALKVEPNPKIEFWDGEMTYLENSDAIIRATYKGSSPVDIQLLKQEVDVIENDRLHFHVYENDIHNIIDIHITKVCKTDAGTYSIFIFNKFGYSDATFVLNVIDKCEFHFPKELVLQEDICKIITILHYDCEPFSAVKFVKEEDLEGDDEVEDYDEVPDDDDDEVQDDDDDDEGEDDRITGAVFRNHVVLKFDGICESDEGTYKVILKNNSWQLEAYFTLRIGIKPKITTYPGLVISRKKSDADVKISLDATRPFETRLLKDLKKVRQDDRLNIEILKDGIVVHISNVRDTDAGTYLVIVTNQYGSDDAALEQKKNYITIKLKTGNKMTY